MKMQNTKMQNANYHCSVENEKTIEILIALETSNSVSLVHIKYSYLNLRSVAKQGGVLPLNRANSRTLASTACGIKSQLTSRPERRGVNGDKKMKQWVTICNINSSFWKVKIQLKEFKLSILYLNFGLQLSVQRKTRLLLRLLYIMSF